MKHILLLLLVAVSVTAFAQREVATQEELTQFYKTTTYVVYAPGELNNMVYNSAIKKAVESRWNSTKYEFISYEEFKSKRKDVNSSFIVMLTVSSMNKTAISKYKLLAVLLGGNYKSILGMPKLSALPIAYADDEFDSYEFALPAIVDFMQAHIKLTKENPKLNAKNILKHYNKNSADINGKTIYILKEVLAKEADSQEKISAVYGGAVNIVEYKQIKKIVDDKTKDAVVALCVAPAKPKEKQECWKFIIGVESGMLYYHNNHKLSAKADSGFLLNDFKKID